MKQARFNDTFSRPLVFPAVLFTLSLIIRIVYVILASSKTVFLSPGGDAEIYSSMAQEFLGGSWRHEPFFRAPGYPLLIALLDRFTGGGLFWPIRILQILVSSISTVFLGRLTWNWFGKRAGWIAGIFWTFYGLSIYFDGEGLITSLFISLLILFLYSFDRYLVKRDLLNVVVPSVLMTLLTLLRANALIFWPVFLLFVLFPFSKKSATPCNKRIIASLAAFLVMIVFTSPVLIHNYKTGGKLSISVQGGINLYIGNHPASSGAFAVDPDYGNDWTEEQVHLRAEKDAGTRLTGAEVSDYYSQKAVRYILDHPWEWTKLEFEKFLILFNSRELANNRVLYPYLKDVNPVFYLLTIAGFPFLLLFSLPFIPTVLKTRERVLPVLVMILFHIATLMLFFVNARYRFPIVPMLMPVFGFGFDYFLRHFKDREYVFSKENITGRVLLVVTAVLLFLPPHSSYKDEKAAWLFHKGTAALRQEKYHEAKTAFQELTSQFPFYKNGYNNLGLIYLHRKDYSTALECFQEELIYHPDNSKALNNLGTVFHYRGDVDKAIDFYNQALEADPLNKDAKINLAMIYHNFSIEYYQDGLLNEALDNAKRAMSYIPFNPNYRYNYALLLIENSAIDSAVVILKDLLETHPGFAPAKQTLLKLRR